MSTQDPEEKSAPEVLTGNLADLSLRVFFDSYRAEQPEFPVPLSLTWGDIASTIPAGTFQLRGASLVLRISSEDADKPFNAFDYDGPRNEPATIELSDGSVLRAPFASLSGCGFGGEDGPYWSEVAMPVWEWLPAKSGVCVFQGDAFGFVGDLADNLTLRDARNVTHGHFRGQGSFLWHLINTKSGPVALAEGTCPPGVYRELRKDLSALQFSMGTWIDLQVLWIVGSSGETIGGVGLGRGAQSTYKRRRPVPHGPAEENCWAAPLFRLVAAKSGANDKHIATALAGYSDALRGHIHGGYLLAQVALEAFCSQVGSKREVHPLVTSKKSWKKWVKEHATDIAQHCPDAASADILLRNLLSATRPPSGRVVETAFRAWGIELPKVLVDELGQRAPAAHRFVMFDEEEGDIQDAADRVNMIQFLLAAAISKDVGYTGAIVGWERDRGGNLLVPSFWNSEVLPAAKEWFACWRNRGEGEPW